jgi:hypothetical protein
MAHFAEIDTNNVTIRCLVVNNEDILDENGIESEAIGASLLSNIFGGNWVQTSYNRSFRKNYAGGPGWIWDVEKNMFYLPRPFPSFRLNEVTGTWEPPEPIWNDGRLKVWVEDDGVWEYVDDVVYANTPENSPIPNVIPQVIKGSANTFPHSDFVSGNIW